MIDENSTARARKERDDAEANLKWETAKNDGEKIACTSAAELFRIVMLSNQLTAAIKEMQAVDEIWDSLLDGKNNNDLENSFLEREIDYWIGEYGEKYARRNA